MALPCVGLRADGQADGGDDVLGGHGVPPFGLFAFVCQPGTAGRRDAPEPMHLTGIAQVLGARLASAGARMTDETFYGSVMSEQPRYCIYQTEPNLFVLEKWANGEWRHMATSVAKDHLIDLMQKDRSSSKYNAIEISYYDAHGREIK